jgi:hypothetical protein
LVRWWPCASTYAGKTSHKIILLLLAERGEYGDLSTESLARLDLIKRSRNPGGRAFLDHLNPQLGEAHIGIFFSLMNRTPGERLLQEFDTLWFDCLNGDSRETGFRPRI